MRKWSQVPNTPYGLGARAVVSGQVHLDPWLGGCPWLVSTPETCGALGQRYAAQGHLRNMSVGPGDIFLFFSRFIEPGKRNGLDIPGTGYFPTLDRCQVLSHCDPSVTPRVWALPRFFMDQKPSYLPKAPQDWRAEGDTCCVKSPATGQEFVTDLTESAIDWVRSMFRV